MNSSRLAREKLVMSSSSQLPWWHVLRCCTSLYILCRTDLDMYCSKLHANCILIPSTAGTQAKVLAEETGPLILLARSDLTQTRQRGQAFRYQSPGIACILFNTLSDKMHHSSRGPSRSYSMDLEPRYLHLHHEYISDHLSTRG